MRWIVGAPFIILVIKWQEMDCECFVIRLKEINCAYWSQERTHVSLYEKMDKLRDCMINCVSEFKWWFCILVPRYVKNVRCVSFYLLDFLVLEV